MDLVSFMTKSYSGRQACNACTHYTRLGHGLFFLEIFEGNKQHPKAFPVLFPQMLVVDFVSPSDPPGIPVVGIPEDLKPLVDKNVMHQKVGDPIGQDPESYGVALPEGSGPQIEKAHAHHRIKDEKCIVSLEPGIVVFPVMVPVQDP
jgi:hypothetical protein